MLVTLVQLAKYTASLVQYSSVNLLRFQKPKMGRTLHNHMRQLHSEGTSSDPFRFYVHFICDVVEEGIWFSRWDEPNIAEKPVYLAFDCWANSLGTCFAPVKPMYYQIRYAIMLYVSFRVKVFCADTILSLSIYQFILAFAIYCPNLNGSFRVIMLWKAA